LTHGINPIDDKGLHVDKSSFSCCAPTMLRGLKGSFVFLTQGTWFPGWELKIRVHFDGKGMTYPHLIRQGDPLV
jgi:hypothetical protein